MSAIAPGAPSQTTKRPVGRPAKFTVELAGRICRCVEQGMPLKLAASAAGVHYNSLITYRSKHPDFRDALESAAARGAEKRLKKIEGASEAGDWRAAAWLLEHCMPEHFAKTRIQVEALTQVEHSFVIPQETLNAIAETRARLESRQHDNEQRLLGNGH